MDKHKALVVISTLAGFFMLLSACRDDTQAIQTQAPSASPTAMRTVLRPAPSATAPSAAKPTQSATPIPILSHTDDTLYLGGNQVRDLLFVDDDLLWAATSGGAIRWDLAAGSPTQYTTADGLASNYVNGVAQAPDGSFWFATLGGVSHLDAEGWTNYAKGDELIDDAVQAIAVDQGGIVWAGTTVGVSRFDGTTWTTDLEGDRTWDIAVAPDGALWFANDAAGLHRYTPADDTWARFALEDDPFAPGVKTAAVDLQGQVWSYLGYDQVYRFDGAEWHPAYAASGQWVCDAAFESDGTPWIATCDGYRARGAGLATGAPGAWDHVGKDQGLASDNVPAVAIGPGGQVAAGTDDGLSLFRQGEWQTLRHGPARNRITTVAVTPDGAAWFGFGDTSWPPAGGGVSRFDGEQWTVFNSATGLPISDNVRHLAVDPEGRPWAAAGCELAYRADGAWQRVAGCEELTGNVHNVAFGPGGVVWVATDFAVFRFDGRQWTRWEDLLPTFLAVTPDGSVLIGQSALGEGGVWSFDGESWQPLPDAPSCVGQMVVDGEGTLWATVCWGEGLYKCLDGAWQALSAADGLPEGGIVDIAVSGAGKIVVATEHGIGYLSAAGWAVHERTWEGDVRELAATPDGSIWLATSRGAMQVRMP